MLRTFASSIAQLAARLPQNCLLHKYDTVRSCNPTVVNTSMLSRNSFNACKRALNAAQGEVVRKIVVPIRFFQ